MQQNQADSAQQPVQNWKKVLLFIVLVAIGLFWAKWQPYFAKIFIASSKHSIGKSILAGLPSSSWAAAWGYARVYFLAIWKALLVAVIVASLIQVLLPRNWVTRALGKTGFLSTMTGGLLALPGMMCTCCAAPIVIGLRKCKSSVGAAVAFWFGNTAINPAVLIFMFFVLGWKFTVLRLVFGLILVFGVSYLANRLAGGEMVDDSVLAVPNTEDEEEQNRGLASRWFKALWRLIIGIVPVYIISVLLLAFARAWLFPAGGLGGQDSIALIAGLAIAGTFFVIPTAAEIPIIQALLSMWLGTGAAAALLITLPVISLPSMLMVRKALPAKVMLFLMVSVIVLGIVAGFIAKALF
ncbi:permease [Aneurinibacillus sp. Ricciae_BoGa-3]|uniref:permease n=1 Tax=Aneurinibacillus sp. Ricciae_BoGa-3 TaxID=3022697 RepID=UPI00234028C8|nr:permease [Aneurinibacillus sp. Ricciae_BoGa-3]WCK54976.1 permease [Aneurinibacillus sp. Ricciae_BoGa-3]